MNLNINDVRSCYSKHKVMLKNDELLIDLIDLLSKRFSNCTFGEYNSDTALEALKSMVRGRDVTDLQLCSVVVVLHLVKHMFSGGVINGHDISQLADSVLRPLIPSTNVVVPL